MMSMNNVGSAGQALHYFGQDNYYTQDQSLENSEWWGSGAKQLGLSGQVDKHSFFELLNGKVEGQELGKTVRDEKTGEPKKDHRPGTDITFSAPKSVSIMAEVGGKTDVRKAHEAAVKKALSHIEKELTYTRQTVDGITQPIKTGNLTVAMFRHNTSRDLDPQTHTHAVIMNATRREDGQWRSVSNEEIFASQRLVGAIYNAELASQLRELGYKLTAPDEKGNFEIEGISREQIEHFSQRRAGITAALNSRGIDIDGASAKDKEAATLATRARKTDVDHDKLLQSWSDRAKSVGINIDELHAQAVAERVTGKQAPALTGRQAMEFATAHLIEREVVVSRDKLLETAIKHSTGRVSPEKVMEAFNKLVKDGDLVALPKEGQYTTKRMLNSERWALEQVRAHNGSTQPVLSGPDLQAAILAVEKRQGFAFSPGQRDSLELALSTTDRYVAVQGLAGTGKTTMLNGLNAIAAEREYVVRGMAPTGAAAKVMQKESGINTDTVSMFMIKEIQLQKDLAFAKEYAPDFQRKAEVWVVDESSFLAQRQMAQLHKLAEGAGAKVIYLGDLLQLQGVEAGKPFELGQKEGMSTAFMTEINRQKTEDLKAVVDTIVGRDKLEPGQRLTQLELSQNTQAFQKMDKAGMVIEVRGEKDMEDPGSAVLGRLVKDVLTLRKDERRNTIVITPYNADRYTINQGVRAGLQEQGEISKHERMSQILVNKGWTRAQQKEAQYYKAGDVIRVGRDYQQIQLKKDDYARVTKVDAKQGLVYLQKEDGQLVAWEPKRHTKVEVYASEARQIAAGDLIRMTRNGQDLKNGEVAEVVAVHGSQAALRVPGRDSLKEVDLNAERHWDHAYASTVHASQGATRHRTYFHIRAPQTRQEQAEGADVSKVFGNRSFYVGATRASHEMKVYTDDKVRAAQAVGVKQDKTSAVELLDRQNQQSIVDRRAQMRSRPDYEK